MRITGLSLNRSQSVIVWVAVVAIALMCLCPPWIGELHAGGDDFHRSVGYSFFLEPPHVNASTTSAGGDLFSRALAEHPERISFSIDFKRLAIQIVFVLLAALSLAFILREKNQPNGLRSGSEALTQ